MPEFRHSGGTFCHQATTKIQEGVETPVQAIKLIEFLDVLIDISTGYLNTKIFVKPTDSPTYLHRRSYHNSHVFKSVPTSQFKRAIIICSNHDDQIEAINYMYQKFISCDYSKEELDIAKTKALLLNRNNLLKLDNPTKPTASPDLTYILSPTATTTTIPKSLMFISTYSCFTIPLKLIIQDLKVDIATLIGHENIVFTN